MKTCPSCEVEKPLTEFYKSTSRTDGRFRDCKACVLRSRRQRYEREGDTLRARVAEYQAANPEKVRETRRRTAKAHPKTPEENRRRHLLKKYGLTPASFDALFDEQGEACAICKSDEPGRSWTVDHDHSSGEVRGILCWHCNVALGHFRDDVSSIMAAADYLLRTQSGAVRGVA